MSPVFIQHILDVAVLGGTTTKDSASFSEVAARADAMNSGFTRNSGEGDLDLTAKGLAFFQALKDVKEPVAVWSIPQ